ncbi:MAG TPA: TIR domain-containing protein, partial [Longimicrobium sp.]|nr:TIR domain-containing protein [Longimicrobium sp.]
MKTIFVSYVREDESWRDRVLLALEGLRRGGRLTLWYDVGLRSGERWSPEILRQLNRADAFLVLASEAYQRSAYIRGTEFPRIEERVGRGEARLFWVPIDLPSDAGEAEGPLAFLREYQAAHGSREPLERLNEQGGAHLSNALLRVDSQFKAWANDGLRASAGHPRPDAAPPLSLDDLGRVERRYLNEVVRDVQYLKVSGLGSPPGESGRALRRLPLESVYITLRADPTTLADRLQTRALHRELAALGADGGTRGEDGREPHARPKTPQEIIAERGPHAAEPDSDPGEAELVLEDAFRDERVLVILGDPGSGKSVLCRWLALQLARRSLASWGLGPAGPADASALGPPRLPILLRVADLNGWLRAHVEARGAGQTPDLMEAIGTHGAAGVEEVAPREAAALFRAAIEEKRAVVLLDGLDEVPDAGDRELITDALEAFATRWVLDPGGVRRQGRPGDTGGNQLVVTSRVTGYHLAPLRFESDVAAHYRIRPLDDERVRRFCAHVARLFDEQRPDEALGRQLLEDLELSLLPGLDRLKRNPLLLTSLISYWYPRRRLPRSRAELYHALLLDLCARWRSMDATLDGVSETLRAWVADDERLLDLLGVVAREIHLEHPSGQIARPALERFVRDRLVARVTGTVSLEMEARDAEEDVRALMILMSTQVGALVEVGPDIFRFLHLTFQEYLVGRDLVRGLAADGAEEALAEAFLERLDEPRWREPVLFAFGELGLPDAPGSRRVDRGTVLRALRQSGLRRRQAAAPAALGLLIADLVAELSPEEVGAEDVTETIWALAEAYRSYGPSPEVEEQRLRVAERLAELRRAAPGSEAVDREVRALVASRDELAPALAHLYWERRWLVPGVLDAFAARLGADAGEWGWPMHAALRWALLPPEGRITPEPVETLTVTPPNDPDSDPGRARRRFERAYPVWERMKRAHGERVLDTAFPAERFPLRAFFAEDPARWERLLSDPADARAAVALLAPVDDWRSAYWRREYLQLAQFLQRSDIVREATIDAQPEAFLPRWGRSGDIIYDCAVYLDVNDTTGGRFRFHQNRRVELRPDLVA